jgi:hypothetical protein
MLQRVAELTKARQSQEPTLRDIQQFMLPYRGRFQSETQQQRGQRKGLKIINNTAGRALGVLQSGFMGGASSPGRPWFDMTTADADLAKFTPVRRWLDVVARTLRLMLSKSNFYNQMPGIYGECAGFGTAALLECEDPHDVVRFYSFTIGSYAIAQDDRLVVDTFVREYMSTVRQIVGRFGTDKLSNAALNLWRSGKIDQEIPCVHLIRPNLDRNPRGFGWQRMPIIEEYWEKSSDRIEPLYRSGYEEQALFCPRWDVSGDDLWGKGIGHDILGDVKQLQFLEKRKEDVLDKHTNPPLEAGVEFRGKRISLLSGDVTYSNASLTGGTQIRPIVTTLPTAYQYAAEDIRDLMERIKSACFEDLFLMLANDERSGTTAREVEERHQEKLQVLGPVLERMQAELYGPVIDRTFAIAQRLSKPVWDGKLGGTPILPKPPAEMQDKDLRVEYTSILAQAAKSTNVRSLEAFATYVGGLAQAKAAADQAGISEKVDWDQSIDEYADAQGIPADMIVSDEDVKVAREAKAQMMASQQALAAAPAMKDATQAAKNLNDIPPDSPMAQNLKGLVAPLTPGVQPGALPGAVPA